MRTEPCMTDKAMDATAAQLQQLLEHAYAHLEWRVRVNPPPRGAAHEAEIVVHARTRDFRYRCRVSRPWARVQGTRSLRRLVSDVAAEAEQLLTDQEAEAP